MNAMLEWVLGSPSSQAGAIDVIAVRRPDGTLSCSPFHVKLGKASKKGEKKIVRLRVNGKDVDLSMKLGPAGEAFFVERTREFVRRDRDFAATTHFPADAFLSPREAEDATDNVLSEAALAKSSMQINTHCSMETEKSLHPKSCAMDRKLWEKPRVRSFSESDAQQTPKSPTFTISQFTAEADTQALRDSPRPIDTSSSDPSTGQVDLKQKRARAASDMSELLEARVVRRLDAITASSSSTNIACDGEEKKVDEVCISSVVKEDAKVSVAGGGEGAELTKSPDDEAAAAVSWMWKWGTLPVKKKNKASSGDLQTLPHQQKSRSKPEPMQAVSLPLEDKKLDRKPPRSKDVRIRAVSLPQFPVVAEELPLGWASRRLASDSRASMGGIKAEIPLGALPTSLLHEVPTDFTEMFAAASVDSSLFRALSLCGDKLTKAICNLDFSCDASSEVLTTPHQLRHLLDSHRISPKDIIDRAVLGSPELVVILDDFLLPLNVAEKVLVDQRATLSLPDTNLSGSVSTPFKNIVDERKVISALTSICVEREAAGLNPLPIWAGRRISSWGCEQAVQSALSEVSPHTDNAIRNKSDEGTVENIAMTKSVSWQELFSDLVQAYRVHTISVALSQVSAQSSHSDQNCSITNNSEVPSYLLQDLLSPNKEMPISYQEMWRRQKRALGSESTFTSQLTLDAGSSSSLFELDNWPRVSDPNDSGYTIGLSLHDRTSETSSSHHSLPMLLSLDGVHEHELSPVPEAESENVEDNSKDPSGSTTPLPPLPAPLPAPAYLSESISKPIGYMRDGPERFGIQGADGGDSSVGDEGDTDNDNLSIQDIDYDDISPEPAGGNFYESDTDSYLSLSLEDGESGIGGGGTGSANSLRAVSGDGGGGDVPLLARRRLRRYRYRKVLVPSQEQLELLDLKDGSNDIVFELDGCAPLKASLFVWPADSKIVVTDLEGVFSRPQSSNKGVWISLLGGGSYYSAPSSKTELDECIRLFAGLQKQGYRIIYLALGSQSSAPSVSPLLSSQEYLKGIKASTGEVLPAGPVFKSPDSLVRAFGAARTEVFKASALRGVKSLFPSSHNPYHACFCTRETDIIPFSRFGFPEGRIFILSSNGQLKAANRTCTLTFAALLDMLEQIFPSIIASEHALKVAFTAISFSGATTTEPSVITDAACTPAESVDSTKFNDSNNNSRKLSRGVVDDSFSDFNFWRIPPAVFEDEY